MNYDIFISHASEDKDTVARPLNKALKSMGLNVWLDEERLTLGDQLLRVINDAFTRCRFGVVVLSPDFFAKEWPQRELDGLMALESVNHKKVLPVWHQVDQNDIQRNMPLLAGKLAISTSNGIGPVAEAIYRAVKADTPDTTTNPNQQSDRNMEPQALLLHAITSTIESQGGDPIQPQLSNQLGDAIGLTPFETMETLTRLASEGKIMLTDGMTQLPGPDNKTSDEVPTIHAAQGATVITAPVTGTFVGGNVENSAVGAHASNNVSAPQPPIGDLIQLIAALRTTTPSLSDEAQPTAEVVANDARQALTTLQNDNASDDDKKQILSRVSTGLQALSEADKNVRSLIPTIKVVAARIGEWMQNTGLSS